jgi:hypothetical protein
VTIAFLFPLTPTPTPTATATATALPTLTPGPNVNLCTGFVPCALGLPLPPITSSLVAPYIGYSIMQSCYTGGYCPEFTPTPPPAPTCIPQTAGYYVTQPDGSQIWMTPPQPIGTYLCPAGSVTPAATPGS